MLKSQAVKNFYRDNFFSGLLVVIPILASIYVLVKLLSWIYGWLEPFFVVPKDLTPILSEYLPRWLASFLSVAAHALEFGIVVVVLLALVALVGMITKIGVVNLSFRFGERVLGKIPLVGMVYSAVKQLMQAIFSGQGNFSRVVLVEFPRPGVWCLGLVSREADPSFCKLTGKKMVSVFMPTTPNITTGFLLMISPDELIELKLSIEDAFKVILSGGMVLAHELTDEASRSGEQLIEKVKERIAARKKGTPENQTDEPGKLQDRE